MSGRFLPLLLLCSLPAVGQEAERRGMLEKAGPSVVALRTAESYGSGLILDARGTILTNAHVIVSPLPMKVEAQFMENGAWRSALFSKVLLIGVHPQRDLAIVRIDPSEHQATLQPITISKQRVAGGDLVHAIGFPSTLGGQKMTCTAGEVTVADKYIDMPGYFEFTAEVHTGSSGGPIVDLAGNAVGVVTRGKANGEPVAWAIPLHDLRPDQFVPLERRPKDPAKASLLLRTAEELLKKAGQKKGRHGSLAEELFHRALLEDISNPDTYYKIGMLQRHLAEYSTAAAYLMRSVQLQPWGETKQGVYHELGVALFRLRRTKEAEAIWNEGIAKYPTECGDLWDDLAVAGFDTARFFEAACASRASLHAFGSRGQKMNELYDQCRRRLDADGISRLTAYEKTHEARVEAARKKADHARENGQRFITAEAEAVVRSFEGVQKEAADFDFATLGKGPNAPKPIEIPDKDLLSLFVRSRIAAAGEHLQAGKIGVAAGILEDVVRTHPDHPETAYARELLAIIRRQK